MYPGFYRYIMCQTGTKADDDDEDMDDKLKECEELNQEAKMPLFDLLAKYKKKCKLINGSISQLIIGSLFNANYRWFCQIN